VFEIVDSVSSLYVPVLFPSAGAYMASIWLNWRDCVSSAEGREKNWTIFREIF
jgi:hypothetical protein